MKNKNLCNTTQNTLLSTPVDKKQKQITLFSLLTRPESKRFGRSLGTARLLEGESFYRLSLNMFPKQLFYMAKNKFGEKHTIYSKIERNTKNGKIRFRKPVGGGALSEELKAYLKLSFNLPKANFFMCLFPKRTILKNGVCI